MARGLERESSPVGQLWPLLIRATWLWEIPYRRAITRWVSEEVLISATWAALSFARFPR